MAEVARSEGIGQGKVGGRYYENCFEKLDVPELLEESCKQESRNLSDIDLSQFVERFMIVIILSLLMSYHDLSL